MQALLVNKNLVDFKQNIFDKAKNNRFDENFGDFEKNDWLQRFWTFQGKIFEPELESHMPEFSAPKPNKKLY